MLTDRNVRMSVRCYHCSISRLRPCVKLLKLLLSSVSSFLQIKNQMLG